jgi:hypothetical protein
MKQENSPSVVGLGATRLLVVESSPLLSGQALYLVNGCSACILLTRF